MLTSKSNFNTLREVKGKQVTDEMLKQLYDNCTSKDFINLNGNISKGYPAEIANFIMQKIDVTKADKIKILVINDLSFHMYNYLTNAGILPKNITLAFGKWNKDGTPLNDKKVYTIMNMFAKSNFVEFERDANNIVTLEEIMSMKNNVKFDYIIGNPPYSNTLHGDILYEVFKAHSESTIIWLAPHNLSWNADKGNRLQKLRDDIEPNFLSYSHIGKNFGDMKLDLEIGIFVFKPYIEDNYTFEEAMLDDNPNPIRKSILQKIHNADRHFKFNGWVSRLRDIDGREIGVNHYNKQLIEKNVSHMQKSLQPNSLVFVAASGMRLFNNKDRFCVKEITVENFSIGFAELLCDSKEEQEMAYNNILNNYDYRAVLRLLSTKRDFKLNRPWPKTVEDCHFTEEELAYLRKNYGDKINEEENHL